MKAAVRTVCLAGVALALAASAAAQDPLGRRVSLDFKAMAPAEAFRVLADAVGLRAVVEPDVTAPVDVLVRNVRARTALDAICDSIDCRWTVTRDTIAVKAGNAGVRMAMKAPRRAVVNREALERIQAALKQPLPAGTRFENAPLSEVVAHLGQLTGVTIEVTAAATEKVTADVSNLALMSALRRIAEPFGVQLVYRISRDAAGGTPQVMITIGLRKTAQRIRK